MIQQSSKKPFNPNTRISVFMVMFSLLLLIVCVRLFNIQIIDASRYQLAAKRQYESKISLKPLRGIIFDRKMNPLVSTANSFSFAADPNMLDNKDSVAELFASVFEKDRNYYLDKLNSKNTSFVWLERRVDQKYAARLEDLSLSGVIKLNESRRVYNYDRLASLVIGTTDVDNNGISGIELQYNDVLAGKDGYVVMQKDGLGRKRSAVEYPRMEPQNGDNLVLTIDMNIQKIIEEELENTVYVNNADGAKCVVMAVKTGEVLGVYSTVNKDYFPGTEYQNKLSVVTDLYEPGSTFKIVTAGASLEEGIQDKNDIIQVHGGEYQIYGLKITDSHKFSSLTFQQVMEQSSNVGMIQVASKLGEKKFYKYARDFGFGNATGIDFPGEGKGILKRPVDFSPVSLKFMAIGYEILVTALQMTNAYASVANDGILMEPFLVKRELSPDGTLVKECFPVAMRQVVSKSTSKTLTELLYGVVERGTGVEAKINNVKIAGKTGTSQKLIEGQYSRNKYTSSFIGYFPADDPRIVISVIIDAPKADEYYGGKVAAPVFRNIAERIINLTGLIDYYNLEYTMQNDPYVKNTVASEQMEDDDDGSINLVNFDLSDAVRILNEKKIKFDIISQDGSKVNSQTDAVVIKQDILTGEEDKSVKKIKLFVTSSSKNIQPDVKIIDEIKMPDLTGCSLRKTIRLMSSMGLDFLISGHGKVINQSPGAGSVLTKNQHIIIYCEPVQRESVADYSEKILN